MRLIPILGMFAVKMKMVMSACSNSTMAGCNSTHSTCGVEFIENVIYGCQANWTDDGGSGVPEKASNPGYPCADDYMVCGSEPTVQYVKYYGMTETLCKNPDITGPNEFYAARIESLDGLKCISGDDVNETAGESGKHFIFGCASNASWVSYPADVDCSGFAAVFNFTAMNNNGGADYGWTSQSDSVELRENLLHSGDVGGVMCCKKPQHEFCQEDVVQDCSQCARFGACVNSIDPHCTTTEALACKTSNCAQYAKCNGCNPGWDCGCLAVEHHNRESSDSEGAPGDGNSCNASDTTDNGQPLTISFRFDGTCNYMPAFGVMQKVDCADSDGVWKLGGTIDYIDGGDYMVPDYNTVACVEDTDASMNFGGAEAPADFLDVNIYNRTDQVCVDTSDHVESPNKNESKSIWGLCGGGLACAKKQPCDNGEGCGPVSCTVNASNPHCMQLDVFGDTACVNGTEGNYIDGLSAPGDHTVGLFGDNICRKDGSGRSFYAVKYDCAEQKVTGVVGCDSCTCDSGCTDIGTIERETCTSEAWLNGLTIYGSGNHELACNTANAPSINAEMAYADCPTAPSNTEAPSASPSTSSNSTDSPTTAGDSAAYQMQMQVRLIIVVASVFFVFWI